MDSDDEDWEVIAFDGTEVPCIEFMDNHDEMWAATLVEGETHLYYSYANILPEFEEILFGGEPFNHDAKDMAVIPIIVDTDRQSVYIAGDDGLYLIDCSRDGQIYGYFDFQYDASITAGSPFRYDRHVKAVDYYQIDETPDKAYIIVGTENNVFLIEEVRSAEDAGVIALHVSDISKGAFYCNVVSTSVPEFGPEHKEIFALSDVGIIKKYDGEGWKFEALVNIADQGHPALGILADYGLTIPNDVDSIIAGRNDPLCLLASTAPEVTPPHIWASGDSGRSWIDLPLGDIPNDVSINRLASSEDGNPGFVAGTSVGVFYIGDIFQDGKIIIENDTIAIYDYSLGGRPPGLPRPPIRDLRQTRTSAGQ